MIVAMAPRLDRSPVASRPMRVLVVEDDADVRAGVKAGLEAAGFAVDEADDLPGGVLLMDVNRYDCLVLDRTLPAGDAADGAVSRGFRLGEFPHGVSSSDCGSTGDVPLRRASAWIT